MKWLMTLCAFAGSLCLAGTWTATTADFTRQDGELVAMDTQGVTLGQAANPARIAWRDLVALQQQSSREVAPEPFLLSTRDGQRIWGTPTGIRDENISWRSSMLGEVQVPMEQVMWTRFSSSPRKTWSSMERRIRSATLRAPPESIPTSTATYSSPP